MRKDMDRLVEAGCNLAARIPPPATWGLPRDVDYEGVVAEVEAAFQAAIGCLHMAGHIRGAGLRLAAVRQHPARPVLHTIGRWLLEGADGLCLEEAIWAVGYARCAWVALFCEEDEPDRGGCPGGPRED